MNLRYEWMRGRKPFPIGLQANFVSTSKRVVVLIPRTSLYCAQQRDWRLYDGL
jgi:hypothetical protein